MNAGLLAGKDVCTGCGACVAACPAGAITFSLNEDDFLFPAIDSEKCTNCGRCRNVCLRTFHKCKHGAPAANFPSFYAVQHHDASVLNSVSSGGAFWALAKTMLSEGGVVYGAVQSAVDSVRHCRAETVDEASAMRRSKYLPSEVWQSYPNVKADLEASRSVLFTGTGCQIAGLIAFLGGRVKGLVTAEVICHGIPTIGVWRGYIASFAKRFGACVEDVVFRDKTYGWKRPAYRLTTSKGDVVTEYIKQNPYHSAYLKGLFNRKSCGTCRFTGYPRVADLSLADYWKYDGPSLDSSGGVSLVSVNTEAGFALFKRAEGEVRSEQVSQSAAEASCRHLILPPKESPHREDFLKMFRDKGFDAAVERFARKVRQGLLSHFKRRFRKLLKKFLPYYEKPSDAKRHAAMEDAFVLLAKKGVPVYFCNRVGLIKDKNWLYGDLARSRIARKAGFPEMLSDVSANEADFREIYGAVYSPGYIAELSRIPQIVDIGGICRHEDSAGRYVNVAGGRRVTAGQPEKWRRTLYVYGRCGAFGYAVEDSQTLPSFLQSCLKAEYPDFRVVNCGLWGGDDPCVDGNFLHDVMGMKEGDAVLFYRRHPDSRLISRWMRLGVRYLDITKQWHKMPESKSCFFDKPGHMNAKGYEYAAELISKWMIESGMHVGKVNRWRKFTARNLNSWLKDNSGGGDGELDRYLRELHGSVAPLPAEAKVGSIVVNCNPFTKGHRYLIETAAKQVDRLYVFVVEEDRSFFRFADRLEMVKNGVADLPNVVVKPSGRFMISALTFPQYFMKDYVREKGFDASSDVLTFCQKIAPSLGISVRFAGEEPFDPVTENYNRCMEKLLPAHGIRFCEIPRFEVSGRGAVNATAVRKFLKERDWNALADLVPSTTIDVLRRRYAEKEHE